jgi:hypothetical protein
LEKELYTIPVPKYICNNPHNKDNFSMQKKDLEVEKKKKKQKQNKTKKNTHAQMIGFDVDKNRPSAQKIMAQST